MLQVARGAVGSLLPWEPLVDHSYVHSTAQIGAKSQVHRGTRGLCGTGRTLTRLFVVCVCVCFCLCVDWFGVCCGRGCSYGRQMRRAKVCDRPPLPHRQQREAEQWVVMDHVIIGNECV